MFDVLEFIRVFLVISCNYINMDEIVEEIYDCMDEDLLIEFVMGRIVLLIIDVDVDVNILVGMLGFVYGVAVLLLGGIVEL